MSQPILFSQAYQQVGGLLLPVYGSFGTPADGQVEVWVAANSRKEWGAAGAATVSSNIKAAGMGGQFGDGLNAITTAGLQVELRAPWAGAFTRMVLEADASCSAVVDVKNGGTSIFTGTSVKPTLSSSTTDDKTDMTDITTALAAGDDLLLIPFSAAEALALIPPRERLRLLA